MIVMGMLVVIGGLGFTCIMELLTFRFWHLPVVRRMRWVGKFSRRHPVPRLSLQTKVVLMATTTLILGGAVVFWCLESGVFGNSGVLKDLPAESQAIGSVFQGGITARTAGFNTHDVGAFQSETQFFMILKMMVGASPGSTGGGIKTTAMVILLLVLWSSLRGRPPELFRRRISDDQIRRVLLALVTILIVLNLAVFLMLISESGTKHGNDFKAITFEVVSAFTTTGLSTGITSDVSEAGRVILSVCMFLGRVGPLTLVLALGRKQAAKFEYPGESVMLG
jgi:trk system potassium uptake protein TrkH